MKLDRLLAITMLLINRKRITAKELADHFEVSVRTIYRDIEAICQAGIPVITFQGINGGFELTENYKLDRQMFTAEDINSIIIALKGIASTLDDQKVDHTIAKLKILSSEPEVKTLKPDQLILDFSPWGGNKAQQVKLDLLKEAICENNLITFKYINYQGEVGSRQVEPMALIIKGQTWYFHGFCRSKDDFRTFRLSRIRELTILSEKFQPKDKSLENFSFEQEWKPAQWVNLVLRFTPRYRAIVEDYFDPEKVNEDSEGFLIVNSRMPDEEWTYNLILNYGDGVEVLEPQRIRGIIKEKAGKIVEVYCSSQNSGVRSQE